MIITSYWKLAKIKSKSQEHVIFNKPLVEMLILPMNRISSLGLLKIALTAPASMAKLVEHLLVQLEKGH